MGLLNVLVNPLKSLKWTKYNRKRLGTHTKWKLIVYTLYKYWIAKSDSTLEIKLEFKDRHKCMSNVIRLVNTIFVFVSVSYFLEECFTTVFQFIISRVIISF